MKRIDRIISNEEFQRNLKEIGRLEENRIFCKHQLEHLLDVARVAMIINLEENDGVPKELIYATALLHDIGRNEQYLKGVPHEEASARIALAILQDSGFTEEEITEIVGAISNHRLAEPVKEKSLSGLIYRADKVSRPCFLCDAVQECNWKEEKKNQSVIY